MDRYSRLFFICFILGLATETRAFTLFGDVAETRGWRGDTLSFALNPENCPDGIQGKLDDAMKVWNEVPTSRLTVVRGDETAITAEEALAGTAGVSPTIHCLSNISALGVNADVIPGFATGMRLDSEQRLVYGVLILNAQDGAAAKVDEFEDGLVTTVLAHEIGHILGLGHSSNKHALMYYDASKRTTASLAQDDVDGLSYLYSRDELSGDAVLGGCGVLSGSASNKLGFSYLILLFPLLLAVVSMWRSQHR